MTVATQPVLEPKRLLRVTKADKGLLAAWSEGVSLESDSGLTVGDLAHRAAADRWRLAHDHWAAANRVHRLRPPLYRTAVSRYYYAMYHATRATAFIFHNGDDNEAHAKLPSAVPSDLADYQKWSNTLKDARDHRNRADYDPYPSLSAEWRTIADALRPQALELLNLTKAYLVAKGCPL